MKLIGGDLSLHAIKNQGSSIWNPRQQIYLSDGLYKLIVQKHNKEWLNFRGKKPSVLIEPKEVEVINTAAAKGTRDDAAWKLARLAGAKCRENECSREF